MPDGVFQQHAVRFSALSSPISAGFITYAARDCEFSSHECRRLHSPTEIKKKRVAACAPMPFPNGTTRLPPSCSRHPSSRIRKTHQAISSKSVKKHIVAIPFIQNYFVTLQRESVRTITDIEYKKRLCFSL